MSIVIQKFGGRLLESPDLIRKAAGFIIRTKEAGENPVVIVSAPGRTTDRMYETVRQLTDTPDERELDMLLSVGERSAMALLAIAINADGRYKAVSFTGSQVGIITDTRHTDARVLEVRGYRIRESLEKGQIPIIAGFQGISIEREITTLGRGGSDTTAVALAIAIKADRCELVKESGGIFSADPEIIPDAVLHEAMDYITVQNLTDAGAKVVQPSAVSLARQHNIPVTVTDPAKRNSTLISDRALELDMVAGVILNNDVSVLSGSGNVSAKAPRTDWTLFFNDKQGRYIEVIKGTRSGDNVPAATVSILGWSGRLKHEVVADVYDVLRDWEDATIAVSGMHGKLCIVVKRESGTEIARILHEMFVFKGYIRQRPVNAAI